MYVRNDILLSSQYMLGNKAIMLESLIQLSLFGLIPPSCFSNVADGKYFLFVIVNHGPAMSGHWVYFMPDLQLFDITFCRTNTWCTNLPLIVFYVLNNYLNVEPTLYLGICVGIDRVLDAWK